MTVFCFTSVPLNLAQDEKLSVSGSLYKYTCVCVFSFTWWALWMHRQKYVAQVMQWFLLQNYVFLIHWWLRAQRSWPFNTGCHLCHLHIEIYSVSFNCFTILCTVNDDIPPNSLQFLFWKIVFFNYMTTQSLHTGEPLIIWNTVSLSERLFFFYQILLMTCC